MKRQFRELNADTKQRINTQKQTISDGMREYWSTIPNKPNDGNNESKNSINNENQY